MQLRKRPQIAASARDEMQMQKKKDPEEGVLSKERNSRRLCRVARIRR